MNSYDNFFLPVDDVESAKEFYGDTLGLDLKFDFSDIGMTAYKVGSEEPAIILKESYESLRSKGVKFLNEPFKIRTGHAAEFEDPFGNRLGITDYD